MSMWLASAKRKRATTASKWPTCLISGADARLLAALTSTFVEGPKTTQNAGREARVDRGPDSRGTPVVQLAQIGFVLPPNCVWRLPCACNAVSDSASNTRAVVSATASVACLSGDQS